MKVDSQRREIIMLKEVMPKNMKIVSIFALLLKELEIEI